MALLLGWEVWIVLCAIIPGMFLKGGLSIAYRLCTMMDTFSLVLSIGNTMGSGRGITLS